MRPEPFITDLNLLKEQEHMYDTDDYKTYKPESTKEHGGTLLIEFLKRLRPGIDLTKLSAPTFILKPISFLEQGADYVYPPDFALNVYKEKNPIMRMLLITKWLMTNTVNTPSKFFNKVKPFNPILGEVFRCKWEHEDSTTFYIAEQTVHHPPITANYMENRKKNLVYEGTWEIRGKLYTNKVDTLLVGEHKIYILNLGECYDVVLPTVCSRGILWGSPSIEINDELIIECKKTGLKTVISFLKRSDGKVEGYMLNTNNNKNEKIYSFDGILTKLVWVYDLRRNRKAIFYDASKLKRTKMTVAPLSQQEINESRRVWHEVSWAINKGDLDEASRCKHKIEQYQREQAKLREKRKEKWVPKHFVLCDPPKILNDVPIYQYKKRNLKVTEEEEEVDVD